VNNNSSKGLGQQQETQLFLCNSHTADCRTNGYYVAAAAAAAAETAPLLKWTTTVILATL
jgi:hypothetical protein